MLMPDKYHGRPTDAQRIAYLESRVRELERTIMLHKDATEKAVEKLRHGAMKTQAVIENLQRLIAGSPK